MFLPQILIFSLLSIPLIYSQANTLQAEQFRRFQLLAYRLTESGFTYLGSDECCNSNDESGSGCPTLCNRLVRARINGEVFEHSLGNRFDPAAGLFMLNRLVRNKNSPAFADKLDILIELVSEDTNRVLGRYEENGIRMAANNEYRRDGVVLSPQSTFSLHVSYHCVGYTGYNCQFSCPDNGLTDCMFETGTQVCRNGNLDPPDCTLAQITCPPNHCENGAVCIFVDRNTFSCGCQPGFTGERCEFPVCDLPCDSDFGTCTGPNTCTCIPGYTGITCHQATCDQFTDCLPNGICIVINNTPLCECDTTRFSGPTCQYACNPTCLFGTCVNEGNETRCLCAEGFEGEDCSQKEFTLAPIFESGYVADHQQKIIIGSVVALLVIIAFFVIGVTLYLRQNINKNISVVRKTAYLVNKLQGTAAGELLAQDG